MTSGRASKRHRKGARGSGPSRQRGGTPAPPGPYEESVVEGHEVEAVIADLENLAWSLDAIPAVCECVRCEAVFVFAESPKGVEFVGRIAPLDPCSSFHRTPLECIEWAYNVGAVEWYRRAVL